MIPVPMLLGLLAADDLSPAAGGFYLPPQASTFAANVDWLFNFILWMSIVFFVLIMGALGYFLVKYRGKDGDLPPADAPDHSDALEVLWTVIPSILCVATFYFGFVGFIEMKQEPADAYEIQVTAVKWNWAFRYPNGHEDNNLNIPVDRPVVLTMTSQDVLHSFFVPAFRQKQDVVPGRYTKAWFEANVPGEFNLYCTEYCGKDHSHMLAKAIVHPPGEFELWLASVADITKNLPPAEAGALLVKSKGCIGCHSLDGTANTGPTFKGVVGRDRTFTDGSGLKSDENYIRQSMLEPQAKVVAGFQPVMPTYKGRLKDPEITAIIEYMKTLKE